MTRGAKHYGEHRPWTDEDRDLARRLWSEGLSAGKACLSLRRTRSAVVAMWNRMGLSEIRRPTHSTRSDLYDPEPTPEPPRPAIEHALPVRDSGFIRPPTREQLMRGKA